MARSRVKQMIDDFNAASPEEQKLFLDFVAPEPEPEAPKQTRKKRSPNKPLIAGLPKPGSDAPKADTAASTDEGPKCGTCGNPEDYQDHFQPSPHFHEFEAPKVKKASGK